MNVKKILVPTDFSPYTTAALEFATSLARDSGATLLIVHVQEPPPVYGGDEMYLGGNTAGSLELTRLLEAIVPADPSVPYKHRLIVGDPSHELVQLAKDEGVDLIVMGTHGRSGMTRLLMGSVAETVVRRASCPVMTLKQPVAAKIDA